MSDPTPGEIMRRLDEVARQLGDLAGQLREDRQHAAAIYMRQDVYMAQRQADQAVVADLAGDLISHRKSTEASFAERDKAHQADVAFKRQAGLALAVLSITTVVNVAIALFTLFVR